MSAAAVIIARQRRYMRHYREAGATHPEAARSPEELGCRSGWIFRRLEDRGVFRSVGEGRFYLDEAAATAFVQNQRARALWTLLVFIIVFGIAMLIKFLMH